MSLLQKRLRDPEFRKNIGEAWYHAHWAILDSGQPDGKTKPNPNGSLSVRSAELFLQILDEMSYLDILGEDPP